MAGVNRDSMRNITQTSVTIQAALESSPAVPLWFGEVVLIVEHLRRQGVLSAICEQVRFARRRFGYYEVLDFLAVQIALCHQWGAHLGNLLPESAPLRSPFHGLV